MSHSIPPAPTLLDAVAHYLEQELLPTLSGYHRYQTRIAINVVRMMERQQTMGPDHDAADARELAALLGRDDVPAAHQTQALAEAIRSGELPLETPGLETYLRASLARALAINNPKWAGAEPAPRP